MIHAKIFPINFNKLTAMERHIYFLNTYVIPKVTDRESRKQRRDIDVIRENHRFLWDGKDSDTDTLSWEQSLTLRYYNKLFKEYCIADLTRYKENKIALRWRTEQEVVTGKGQFQCGSRHCEECTGLRTWEVNFKYVEHGAQHNALVKLRLCPIHTEELNYRSKKREIKRHWRIEKKISKTDKKQKIRKPKEYTQHYQKLKEEQKPMPAATTIEVTELKETDEQIWNNELDINKEQPSREQEFERYLADLLL